MRSPGRSSPLGWIGLGILGFLALVAVAAPWLAPYDPVVRSGIPFMRPSAAHLLGTNDVGQDILSALIYGTRVSVLVGIAAAVIATSVGALVGLAAGYSGGWIDVLLMRFVDVMLALPFLPLMIVVGVFFGGGIGTQIFVIAAVSWAVPARELRPQIMSARRKAHVEAARVMGGRRMYVLRRHLLPVVAPLLAPQLVRAANVAILTEASLSFLGLGQAEMPSWGTMLYYAQSRGAMLTDSWRWWVLPPGLAIALVVVALAFMGYALEERAQPRLRLGRKRFEVASAPPSCEPSGSHPLEVNELTVGYRRDGDITLALAGVSLMVRSGESVGLVGVSGSGKTTLCGAAFGALRSPAQLVNGSVYLTGQNLATLPPAALRRLKGKTVALVPQNAMGALNPVIKVGKQIAEAVRTHENCSRTQAERRARDLLELVGIPAVRSSAFPHELSGGMRQRVVLAMAIAHRPSLLIADEPTTGLDPVLRNEFLDLLDSLRSEFGLAILLISHDLGAVLRIVDRLVVIDGGEVVEEGAAAVVAANPVHPATRRLLEARFDPSEAAQSAVLPHLSKEPVLVMESVTKTFGKGPSALVAAGEISLEIRQGEAIGLVGRSGAGKSTLARLACGLESPDRGRVLFCGADLNKRPTGPPHHSGLHLVFQDPYEALPQAMRVGDIVGEPLAIAGGRSAGERKELVRDALEDVSLDPSRMAERFAHELSGGERQRVALARAIVGRPALVIADEPAAMLDTALAAELADLICRLRDRHNMAWLIITHELGFAARVCDRLVVLAGGCIVDDGPTHRVLHHPGSPESEILVNAAREIVNV